ncbi:MAG: hypothetical protein Q8K86_07180 [Candidatus Nanopelagicaceae bacterium]|nr:hypothetical protein [Candidatus Nanopelagicaceae bacterium]
MNVLIVNATESACGVYQFGVNLYNLLNSAKTIYDFHIAFCATAQDVLTNVAALNPKALIFNYHPHTQPYVSGPFIQSLHRPCFGIYHEITQNAVNQMGSAHPFHHWICSDPTITPNRYISKIGRPVYTQYANPYSFFPQTTIGTFGFGFRNKGFARLATVVQEQFDQAIIRAHIAFSKYFDPTGGEAQARIQEMRSIIKKPGIKIVASHNLLSVGELLDFLAQNTVNVFLYDEMHRGISSTIDYALAVNRPIAINRTQMFRHIFNAKPTILIEETDLPTIIRNSILPLVPFKQAWTPQNLVNEVNSIISR